MHNQIILESFNKAEITIIEKHGNKPSNSKCAIFISDEIYRINSFTFGERSLRDLYNAVKKNTSISIEVKQPQVIDGLCKFLGYTNYPDYVINNTIEKVSIKGNEQHISANKKQPIVVSVILTAIPIIVIIAYVLIDKKRWMVWQESQYIEVEFNVEKYDVNQLKLYKEAQVKNFNLIKPTCNYSFFKKDGSVNLWYGKNIKKELEFFTDLGRHPETSKTLKPITKYMIDKYICVPD